MNNFGEIMVAFARMVAEQTVEAMTDKEMVKDRKKFKITLPDRSEVWLTGSSLSEAFIDGWNKYGSQLLNHEPEEKQKTTRTFKEYGNTWLEMYKKPKVSIKWYKSMKAILNNYIYPEIGDMQLHEIKTENIASLYQSTSDLSLSVNEKIKIIVNSILESAIEDEIIDRNVAKTNRLTIYGSEEERTPLTEDELMNIQKNISKLENEDKLLVYILYYTGVRRGEALALRWDDIDMTARIININKSVYFDNNKSYVKDPKTKAGNRRIPIANKLFEILNAVEDKNRVGYVFGNNELYSERKYLCAWKRIIKALEIPEATAHRFRHSFATRMKRMLDVKTLQTIMGHSDSSTTMDIYTHTTDQDIQSARQKMDEGQDAF